MSTWGGNRTVQDLGDCHTEEDFCEDRTTEMDVCKQRDPEADQVLAERFCFGGALQCNCKSGGRGHGSYCCQVSRSVMPDHFQRIFSGIDPCNHVQKCHPDEMSCQDQYDDLQENRQLSGNGTFIGKAAERRM